MRLICAVYILLLALMTSAQCQQTAGDWFNKGNDFYDRGAYDLAVKCYDKMILIDPNNATAWNNKGNAFDSQGKHDDATKCFNEAIRLDSNLTAARNNIDLARPVTESLGSVSGQAESQPETKADAAMISVIKKMEGSIQPPAGWKVRRGTIRSRPLVAFKAAGSFQGRW